MLNRITPLILTFNEEPNLGRVLARLTWAKEVIVLDSGSTDRTRAIAASFPNVRWETRPFDSFASQCNHALDQLIAPGEWVLSLDADYVLAEEFDREVAALSPAENAWGYESGFLYCIDGTPLRGTLYPPRVCLFRNLPEIRYIQDGHAHRLVIPPGSVTKLRSKILHDDRKSLSRWLTSQAKYGEQEANLLLDKPWKELRWSNRLRRFLVFSPFLAPLIYLIPRFGFLDGRVGLEYAFQRMIAEAIISLKMLELKRHRPAKFLSEKPEN